MGTYLPPGYETEEKSLVQAHNTARVGPTIIEGSSTITVAYKP